jgi:hypothetical protein
MVWMQQEKDTDACDLKAQNHISQNLLNGPRKCDIVLVFWHT